MGYEESSQPEESLLPREEPRSKWQIKSPELGRRVWILTGFNMVLFFTSVLLLVKRQYGVVMQPSSTWLQESTKYSPLWGTELGKQLKKYEMQMNSIPFAPPRPSKYRNTIKPSKEVGDAWGPLEGVRTFPITEEDIIAIGKDPNTYFKFPPAYGFGDNAYIAQLDIFHQLHYLNTLCLIT